MNIMMDEDIVHEALVIILEKYKKEDINKGIIPWSYGILDKVILGRYRKEKRRKSILKNRKEQILKIFGTQSHIEEEMEYQERIDHVWKALQSLSKRQKEVFELKLKGYTSDEIRNKLGLSRTAYDSRIFHGTKKIQKALEKNKVI